MKKFIYLKYHVWAFLILVINLSCKSREVNYITYYQKVNEIDSIYRLAEQPDIAVKMYKKLFRKYEPRNQDRIEEYVTYIKLADQKNINFGGEKSLQKLIHLLAPGAQENWHKPYFSLFEKYGIDSLEVENEIIRWGSGLNKELVDSFSVAMDRDQLPRLDGDEDLFLLNDKKNYNLLKWTFENYGYPSEQKIGIKGTNGRAIHLSVILLHLGSSIEDAEDFKYFKNKLFEYVKAGECPPDYYAQMVDRHELLVNKVNEVPYGRFTGFTEVKDTVQVNKNRKSIGLPTIEHGKQISLDFIKKMKKIEDTYYNQQ